MVENLPQVRMGGVAAFSLPRNHENDPETAVLVVETRSAEPADREGLHRHIMELMHEHFGINVEIDLVRPGALPRTFSGKLSRTASRTGYLARLDKSARTGCGEAGGRDKAGLTLRGQA